MKKSNTKYYPKNKPLKSIIENAISQAESSRLEFVSECGKMDSSKINQRDSRSAQKFQRELSRRLDLPRENADSITIETYRRYMSYIKTCVRNSRAKCPIMINKLIALAPSKTHLNNVKKLATLPKKQAQELLKQMSVSAKTMQKRLKTPAKQKSYAEFASMTDALSQKLPDVNFLKSLTLRAGARDELDQKQDDRVTAYQSKSNDRVFDFTGIHELCVDLLGAGTESNLPNYPAAREKSSRPDRRGVWGVALGVALATGRRAYEIIYQSNFRAKNKHTLIISKLAKKRDENESIEITTLVDARAVARAVDRIRADSRVIALSKKMEKSDVFDGYKHRFFSSNMKNKLSETARDVASGLIVDGNGRAVDMRFKDARDVYVISAYSNHVANGGDLKLTRFVRENLGHDDLTTALSYEKFTTNEIVTRGDIMRVNRLETRKNARGEQLRALFAGDGFELESIKKCADFVLSQLDEIGAETLVINSGLLRKNKITSPNRIAQFVKMVRDAGLDLPA
tara:strand:- start:439 stop:1977 length:1539 start_codon:yes stop_codon:yes gene_type:complete